MRTAKEKIAQIYLQYLHIFPSLHWASLNVLLWIVNWSKQPQRWNSNGKRLLKWPWTTGAFIIQVAGWRSGKDCKVLIVTWNLAGRLLVSLWVFLLVYFAGLLGEGWTKMGSSVATSAQLLEMSSFRFNPTFSSLLWYQSFISKYKFNSIVIWGQSCHS